MIQKHEFGKRIYIYNLSLQKRERSSDIYYMIECKQGCLKVKGVIVCQWIFCR